MSARKAVEQYHPDFIASDGPEVASLTGFALDTTNVTSLDPARPQPVRLLVRPAGACRARTRVVVIDSMVDPVSRRAATSRRSRRSTASTSRASASSSAASASTTARATSRAADAMTRSPHATGCRICGCSRRWSPSSCCMRVLYALFAGPSPDEAYYWLWGQHPGLSYYDHAPFHALAARHLGFRLRAQPLRPALDDARDARGHGVDLPHLGRALCRRRLAALVLAGDGDPPRLADLRHLLGARLPRLHARVPGAGLGALLPDASSPTRSTQGRGQEPRPLSSPPSSSAVRGSPSTTASSSGSASSPTIIAYRPLRPLLRDWRLYLAGARHGRDADPGALLELRSRASPRSASTSPSGRPAAG